jgi:hypothetical protein
VSILDLMEYSTLIKKLVLPDGVVAPARLVHDDIEASAITRDHLSDDVKGINASLNLIRRTRGGGWPDGAVTEEFNFVDLVWHELEFRDGTSFTYAVYGPDGYLGCCYLYPMGRRTELTEELMAYDVDVSWWVTPDGYERGFYDKLFDGLQQWLASEFPFWRAYYSNSEIPE